MLGILSLLQREQPRYVGFPETPVDWDPAMKWDARLYIRASSFKPTLLHSKKTSRGNFWYENQVLPHGKMLATWNGNRKGAVKFDGPVVIPSLFDRRSFRYDPNPWMSITPNEIFTLRAGTKRAKGHTVIAGLGLGYQLLEVMKREQVTRVTLVELEDDVVKLVMPKIRKLLPNKPLEVIVGNAKEIVPKLTADAALIDIFSSAGGNSFPRCAGIPSIWVWGGSVERAASSR